MWVGDLIDERFLIERPIGSGGMGSVFVARDRETNELVAVKVLDLVSDSALERFRREARVLAELSHPGIVRYVAHGEARSGEAYLAMEFLEGEDLGQRLIRGALSVEESLCVIRRATEALAFAHDRGIVHRDVKPSNLFLVNGDIERLRLLDFGIAMAARYTYGLTQTGMLLGTVGYMAPEQATGARHVDARADVFALGCVLFECLTGRPAFAADHAVAVLAKVLTEEAPRPSDVRPNLGNGIDSLVGRMLAKRSEERLSDAAAILRELDAFAGLAQTHAVDGAGLAETHAIDVSTRPQSSAHAEQTVVSLILAEAPSIEALSVTPEAPGLDAPHIRAIAQRFRAEFTPLGGRAGLFLFSGKGTAGDQASRAASCALSLHATGNLRAALATGWMEKGALLPIGRVIDEAAALLREAVPPDGGGGDSRDGVLMDDLTADLLGPRFEVQLRGSRRLLLREHGEEEASPPRLLMGKPTPTVGRDRELGLLQLTLEECIADSVARAVLVTGPPGIGKSRLLREFAERVGARDNGRIFVARADEVSAGSSLAIAGKFVRDAVRLPAAAGGNGHAHLREYLAGCVSADRLNQLAEFLGELAGRSSDQVPSGLLQAARNDPVVMSEQKRRAFEAWLDAETRSGGLVLAVEDLQWADAPSVAYLEEALQRLRERSLMVLALGRPEVSDRFPRLWPKARTQDIHLDGLTCRAAERLVRHVLGEAVPRDLIARLVERADGNAFYLEELVRFAAEGREDFPGTVVAMAQSRIDRLESEARRVLRTASVTGESVWSGYVNAAIEDDTDAARWLETLADRELLNRVPSSRFPQEREYSFRHAILRDAAYATLTDEDRVLTHRAAGEWLERAGERDARVIASHFEKGKDWDRAIHWIARAALEELESGGSSSGEALASRGIELGARGQSLGVLLVIRAALRTWKNQPEEALDAALRSIALLPEDNPDWWLAAALVLLTSGVLGRPDVAMPTAQKIIATQPSANPTGGYGMAVQGLVSGLVFLGDPGSARSFFERSCPGEPEDVATDTVCLALLHSARCIVALSSPSLASGAWDLGLAHRSATRSVELTTEAGHPYLAAATHFWLGIIEMIIGRTLHAGAALTRCQELAAAVGAEWIEMGAQLYLLALSHPSIRPEAAREALLSARTASDSQIAALSWVFSAERHLAESRIVDARSDARRALEIAVPIMHRWAAMTLVRAELASGEPRAALETIARALSDAPRIWAHVDIWLHLSRAEALHALDEVEAAHDAIRACAARVRDTAALITRPDLREAYLASEQNHRALELATAWLGSAG